MINMLRISLSNTLAENERREIGQNSHLPLGSGMTLAIFQLDVKRF